MAYIRIILLFSILLIFINISSVLSKYEQNNFIRQYIENEKKPAHLVLLNLCWGKDVQVNLLKEMSEIGISTSTNKKNTSSYHEHVIVFIADMECPKVTEVFANATMNNLIRSPYRWLIFSDKAKDPVNTLKHLPLLPDSDWVLAKRDGKVISMTEMHKASLNHSLQLYKRGFFNVSFIDVRTDRELFKRRKNLHGFTIRMINVIQDSNTTINHMEDGLEPEYDFTTKVSWRVIKIVAEMLNASASNRLTWGWGYKRNGKWDGMVKMIASDEADIGGNCIFVASRLEVISYIDTIVPFRLLFILRQPPLSYVSNIFYLPFTARVWIAMLICTIASCLTLYLTTKFEARVETSITQLDGSMNDALLLTMSAVSQQGSLLEPKKASAPSNSIKSLRQLSDSKLTLAAHDLAYNYNILRVYNDSLHEGIYKRIVNSPKGPAQFYNLEEGVKRIKEGLFAFHALKDLVYRQVEATFLEKEKCDLTEVDFFYGVPPATPIPKHSPYKELFRVQLKRIREAGIQDALNKKFEVPKPICNSQAAFNSVGILDIRGVLFMLLYGFALSIIILMMEKIIFKILNKQMFTKASTSRY